MTSRKRIDTRTTDPLWHLLLPQTFSNEDLLRVLIEVSSTLTYWLSYFASKYCSSFQAWSILNFFFKSKSKLIESKLIESKFSEPKSKSVFYVFVFDFGITSIISKNYDSIYFDTKFNRCYFDKYRIVSFL